MHSIADSHPDFPEEELDPRNADDVLVYLARRFKDVYAHSIREYDPLYFHYITMVDTSRVEFVFEAVRATILERGLLNLRLD